MILDPDAGHGPSGDERGIRGRHPPGWPHPYADEITDGRHGQPDRPQEGERAQGHACCPHGLHRPYRHPHRGEGLSALRASWAGVRPQGRWSTPRSASRTASGALVAMEESKAEFGKLKLDDLLSGHRRRRIERQAKTMVQVGDTAVYDTPACPAGEDRGHLPLPGRPDRLRRAADRPWSRLEHARPTTCTSSSPSRRRWDCGGPGPPPGPWTRTTASRWT